MSWRETLTFPPEVPISEEAKHAVLRYVKIPIPSRKIAFGISIY